MIVDVKFMHAYRLINGHGCMYADRNITVIYDKIGMAHEVGPVTLPNWLIYCASDPVCKT